jgi:hypothetical protein
LRRERERERERNEEKQIQNIKYIVINGQTNNTYIKVKPHHSILK